MCQLLVVALGLLFFSLPPVTLSLTGVVIGFIEFIVFNLAIHYQVATVLVAFRASKEEVLRRNLHSNDWDNSSANKHKKKSRQDRASKLAISILSIFVKDEEYDSFFQHFEEGFEKRRKRAGLFAARLWVWKQVFLTIGPLVWRVVRRAVAIWKLDEIWKKFI